MKGKILITNYDLVETHNLLKYETKLQIVFSAKKGLKKGFIHVPHLAPSEQLFHKALCHWKKLKFSVQEMEEMKYGRTKTWFDLYERQFILEANNRKDFQLAYKKVKKLLDHGTNVVLICYCEDVNRCHRRIIANMFRVDGYTVILE